MVRLVFLLFEYNSHFLAPPPKKNVKGVKLFSISPHPNKMSICTPGLDRLGDRALRPLVHIAANHVLVGRNGFGVGQKWSIADLRRSKDTPSFKHHNPDCRLSFSRNKKIETILVRRNIHLPGIFQWG